MSTGSDIYLSDSSSTSATKIMAENLIKKLRIERGLRKAAITRLEKYFQAHTIEELDYEDVAFRQDQLEKSYEQYRAVEMELLLQDDEPDSDEIDDRFTQLSVLIERLKKQLMKPKQESHSQSSPDSHRTTHLPSIDIQTFDGKDIACYKPFMDLFTAIIHRDARLSDVQKLFYLKKYIKGEPLTLIDNLPLINESYESAVKILETRYNNPMLLVNNHITSILDLPAVHRGTAQQLRDLVAQVRQQISALKNMKEPVDHWDSILVCIMCRKLDPLTVRLFHTDRDMGSMPTINELLIFLDKRAMSLEVSPSFVNSKSKAVNFSKISETSKCKLCGQSHKLFKCPKFILMPIHERLEYVKANNFCKICLCFHANKCRFHFKCSVCASKFHNTLIHHDEHRSVPSDARIHQNQEQISQPEVSLHSSKQSSTNVLLPTVKVLVSDSQKNKYIVRALLDCGSQTSFCTKTLVNKLGIPTYTQQHNVVALGGQPIQKIDKAVNLTLHSMTENYNISVTCSVVDKVTGKLPQGSINLSRFNIPKYVTLADNEFYIPGEITLLLAADIFFQVIKDGKIEGSPEDPILLNTRFGYVISGDFFPSFTHKSVAMHAVVEHTPGLESLVSKFWETEKVPELYSEKLPELEYCEKIFHESVTLNNNRFEVKLPLKLNEKQINTSESFSIALQRFYNLEKRFAKEDLYRSLYINFINEYLELGHAKVIDVNTCSLNDQPLYFLPHHAVLRTDRKTNKLRVVFDGSAKIKGSISLNDMLCNGPVNQKQLFEILILFRTYKYIIMSDIRHMYRQINVHPDHRALQNILWRESPDKELQCLQLKTITYGLTSSAYLAIQCLIELANTYGAQYPLASRAILHNSYCDDIITGANSFQDALQLRKELTDLLQLGSFDLHKWCSNDKSLLSDLPVDKLVFEQRDLDRECLITKALGLLYEPMEDIFKLSGNVVSSSKDPVVPTKRSVLSAVSRLFDPLGFAGPLIVRAKLLLQQIWLCNLGWDQTLPVELAKAWQQFHVEISTMSDIKVNRYLQLFESDETELIARVL